MHREQTGRDNALYRDIVIPLQFTRRRVRYVDGFLVGRYRSRPKRAIRIRRCRRFGDIFESVEEVAIGGTLLGDRLIARRIGGRFTDYVFYSLLRWRISTPARQSV